MGTSGRRGSRLGWGGVGRGVAVASWPFNGNGTSKSVMHLGFTHPESQGGVAHPPTARRLHHQRHVLRGCMLAMLHAIQQEHFFHTECTCIALMHALIAA